MLLAYRATRQHSSRKNGALEVYVAKTKFELTEIRLKNVAFKRQIISLCSGNVTHWVKTALIM